jgi:hypothetical protein
MTPDFLSMMVRARARMICWRNQAGAKSVFATSAVVEEIGEIALVFARSHSIASARFSAGIGATRQPGDFVNSVYMFLALAYSWLQVGPPANSDNRPLTER